MLVVCSRALPLYSILYSVATICHSWQRLIPGNLHLCVIAQSFGSIEVRHPRSWQFGPWPVAVLLYETLRQTGGQADKLAASIKFKWCANRNTPATHQ